MSTKFDKKYQPGQNTSQATGLKYFENLLLFQQKKKNRIKVGFIKMFIKSRHLVDRPSNKLK